MQEDLRAWLQKPAAEVRVQVTAQKQDLKKHHAGGPNTGSTTEPGQQVFANQRLNLEQQKCACEDRKRVRSHRGIMWEGSLLMKSKAVAPMELGSRCAQLLLVVLHDFRLEFLSKPKLFEGRVSRRQGQRRNRTNRSGEKAADEY